MTEKVQKKAGRKPIGDKPMTRNERMQKTNDARRERGVKSFLMHVEPGHLKWIEAVANQSGHALTPVFKAVVERWLDRYTGIFERAHFLETLGAEAQQSGEFIKTYLDQPLPSFEAMAKHPTQKAMKHLTPEQTADYLESATITNSMDAGHAITHMGVNAAGQSFIMVTNCWEETVVSEGV